MQAVDGVHKTVVKKNNIHVLLQLFICIM